MQNKISPNVITEIKENEIFVFGSNTLGLHGRGAAKTALKWGAKWGIGEGISGRTYGIPTKGKKLEVLSLNRIHASVIKFIEVAKHYPQYTFLVTEIGCGLAGYKPKDIAPMFKTAVNVQNILLPKRFWDILK